ncbi:DUF1328 family protein [Limnoglobus roseus]|uniref:DUF1328 domain-containing protein n=1 Tax=Limnoglobus roseus TaxID=2598579 RepID=A0A5C1AB64_9BACT|nr:DUF1328 family protein [Limnoglobus roseus]QEL16471.1 hypothetical protein PX52LOC_03427 [Limnoglobus roseus]
MLRLAIAFFAIALLAATFGFGLIAGLSFVVAQALCAVFLILAVIFLIVGSFKTSSEL